jgi:hypothetical protein
LIVGSGLGGIVVDERRQGSRQKRMSRLNRLVCDEEEEEAVKRVGRCFFYRLCRDLWLLGPDQIIK